MSNDFSDAPLTIDGVTVKPTWPWSPAYRAVVAENMKQSRRSRFSPGGIATLYIEWYADQHGLTHEQAREKIGRAP